MLDIVDIGTSAIQSMLRETVTTLTVIEISVTNATENSADLAQNANISKGAHVSLSINKQKKQCQ